MTVYVWHDGRAGLSSMLSMLTVQHGSAVERAAGKRAVVHWCGDISPLISNNNCEILNDINYTRILLDNEKIRSRLHLHHISYNPPQPFIQHLFIQQHESEYLIPVFLMNALAILQQSTTHTLTRNREANDAINYREVQDEHKTRLLRRLERYAVRAVYALGLDFASVYVRVHRSGKAEITRIDVNPIQSQLIDNLFANAINEYAHGLLTEEVERKYVVFGMDPEFLLRNRDGKIVPASRFLQSSGAVGYDSATVLGRKQTHPLAELRPEPSHNITSLVINLRRTMWHASKQITDESLQWIAGGMPVVGLPLGGHLHISGIKLYSRLIRALDNYLALPLIMIEDHSTSGRRKKYGQLGDVRRPAHGGFEYRTLPSWIVSPRVTKGVLALASVIVQHYDELIDRPLDRVDILIAYKEGNKHTLEPIVNKIWRQLEGTTGYKDQRIYLEPFKDWIMKQRIWNEQLDFRAVWRIPPFH